MANYEVVEALLATLNDNVSIEIDASQIIDDVFDEVLYGALQEVVESTKNQLDDTLLTLVYPNLAPVLKQRIKDVVVDALDGLANATGDVLLVE